MGVRPATPNDDSADEWNALAARYADPSVYVAVVDHDFVLRAACDRAHEMFGIDPSDVLGQSAIEVIHPGWNWNDPLMSAAMFLVGSSPSLGLYFGAPTEL